MLGVSHNTYLLNFFSSQFLHLYSEEYKTTCLRCIVKSWAHSRHSTSIHISYYYIIKCLFTSWHYALFLFSSQWILYDPAWKQIKNLDKLNKISVYLNVKETLTRLTDFTGVSSRLTVHRQLIEGGIVNIFMIHGKNILRNYYFSKLLFLILV